MNKGQYLIDISTQYGAIFSDDPAKWMGWANLIIGLCFVAVAAWLIWVFYNKKHEWDQARPEFDRKETGSFKGFWARYNSAIVAFLAALFVLLGIIFVLVGLFDFDFLNYHDTFS